jgi:glycosyltransferase involved in cell wall biosynthesis
MVEGFLKSGSRSQLLVAGHTPDTPWFHGMKNRAEGKNVTFLGLVKDQALLDQIIMNARAYMHGHSLGGINPALVRVTGMNKPSICIDTRFNREVVEAPNGRLQASLFSNDPASVAEAIRTFESKELSYNQEAQLLGETIRKKMSWENIYQQYKIFFNECLA